MTLIKVSQQVKEVHITPVPQYHQEKRDGVSDSMRVVLVSNSTIAIGFRFSPAHM